MVPVGARVPSDTTRYPKLVCCVSSLITHFSKDHEVLFFENIGVSPRELVLACLSPPAIQPANSQEPQQTRDCCVSILDRLMTM